MISMDEIKERVILVAVDTDGSDRGRNDPWMNLESLRRQQVQKLSAYDPAKRKYPSGNLYRKRKNSGIKGIIVGDARNRNYL